MNFPTITIPDPAAVGKWLDEQLPADGGMHHPHYSDQWSVCHWHTPGDYVHAMAPTPEALLADIRRQLAENDPVENLRKEWIAAGRPPLE